MAALVKKSHRSRLLVASMADMDMVAGALGSGFSAPYCVPLGIKDTAGDIDQAVKDFDWGTPTIQQQLSGRYPQPLIFWRGLPLVIENPAGSLRSGVSPSGDEWHQIMSSHYGYVPGTLGSDGDPVDVFLCANLDDATDAYAIAQKNPSGDFDEYKVMLGCLSAEDAKTAYLANYREGWDGYSSCVAIPMPDFAAWLTSTAPSKAPQAPSSSDTAPSNPASPLAHKDNSTMDPDEQLAAATDASASMITEYEILVAADSADFEILETATDGANSKVLMRVRQLGTIADARNLNGRVYPRGVVQDAISRANGARERANMGVMLSEAEHPEVLNAKGGGDAFADNAERKTATIDEVSDVGTDGRVYITRSIRNTPLGRQVADAFKAGKPWGVSSRFQMRGKRRTWQGQDTLVADWMKFDTWDDVMNPAVPQTKTDYTLLSDSQMAELLTEEVGSGSPSPNENRGSQPTLHDSNGASRVGDGAGHLPASAPAPATTNSTDTGNRNRMKKSTLALKKYRAAIAKRADKAELDAARQHVVDSMTEDESDAAKTGEAFDDAAALADLAKADELNTTISLGAYNSDRPAPTGTLINQANGGIVPEARTVTGMGMTSTADPNATPYVGANRPDFTNGDALKAELTKLGLSDEVIAAMVQQRADSEASAAAVEHGKSVDAAIEAAKELDCVKGLDEVKREYVLKQARSAAIATKAPADKVAGLVSDAVEAISGLLADERVTARGGAGNSQGSTVTDGGAAPNANGKTDMNGTATLVSAAKPWMEHVDKLLAAGDAFARASRSFNPDNADVKRLREHNRQTFINPLIEEIAADSAKYKTSEEWFKATDSLVKDGGDKAFLDSMDRSRSGGGMSAGLDAETTTNIMNQPTILTAFLIQQFQDMQMLQYVHGFGPGQDTGSGGWVSNMNGAVNGETHIGSIFRIPVEYYVSPTGYGNFAGTQYDEGLLVPEGIGIPEAQINTTTLPFAPAWRRIAFSATRDVIKAMGNGPFNYSLMGRALYHIAFDKARRIDKALGDEMLLVSAEYGAVPVANELVDATHNSVYNAAGGVTINLNPAKAANAATATGDTWKVYGPNVVAAVRIVGPNTGATGTYCGDQNGVTPIVRQRILTNMSATGQISQSISNPVSVTIGGTAKYQGAYDDTTLQVVAATMANLNQGTSGTYAVDYESGVILFTAASGIAGNGSLVTSNLAVAYTYETNFDSFLANPAVLPTGVSASKYADGLVIQHDFTAAQMASAPRYSKVNLALMSLVASTNITKSEIFYKQNSPDGTTLMPTANFFYDRNGIMGARHDSPWTGKNDRILMSVQGSTKYAIDTAAEVKGPYPKFEAGTNNIIDQDTYYLGENAVICTPQVTTAAGVVINPVSRSIKLRSQGNISNV